MLQISPLTSVHHAIMNDGVGNPSKSLGFLDKFGQNEDRLRIKRKVELIEEYEQFKLLDEERFRNRFAAKKGIRKHEEGEPGDAHKRPPTTAVAAMNQKGANDDISLVGLQVGMNERLNEIVKKIDSLRAVDENSKITSASHPEQFSNESMGTFPGPNTDEEQLRLHERVLRDRLRSLQEAEERLKLIKNEYNQVKATIMRNEKKESTGFISQMELISSKPKSPGLSVQKTADNNIKRQNQQQYRNDLELQIVESKNQKYAGEETENSSGKEQKTFTKINIPEETETPNCKNPDYSVQREQRYLGFQANNQSTSEQPVDHNLTRAQRSSFLNGFCDMQAAKTDEGMSKKAKYAQELREQIEESRRKKELQKKIDEEYDRKIEEEYHKLNSSYVTPMSQQKSDIMTSDACNSRTGNPDINNKFARGGHGIFGNPLSDEQKTANQKYKEELAKQIEDKRIREETQRRKLEEEERLEAERLAAEQLRMQKKFEHEEARAKSFEKEAELAAETQELEAKYQQADMHAMGRSKTKQKNHTVTASKPQHTELAGQKSQIEPELLIDPQFSTEKFRNQRKVNRNQEKPMNEENSRVIDQLHRLRERVESEKTRIKEALTDQQREVRLGRETNFSDTNKHRPKPARKAAHMFVETSGFKANKLLKPYHSKIGKPNHVHELLTGQFAEAEHMDEQAAYLRHQDSYLRALDENLKQLNMVEVMSDFELRHKGHNLPYDAEEDGATGESLVRANNELIPQSPSEKSLNVDKLEIDNKKRLNRLNKLHSESGKLLDPEEILDQFVKKHDYARQET